ncbi:MAG: hypothetical protein UDK34_01960 [Cyanobacteriota bacterium]|nr:hypothetical protein [Cyanobacteriota bacterium]
MINKINFGEDVSLQINNLEIFHTYTFIDSKTNEKTKTGKLFPSKNLPQLFFKDIVQQYELFDIDYIFLTSPELGDNYFLASYIEEFKKSHNNPKIAILLREDKCKEMIKTFGTVDKIIVDKYWFNKNFNNNHSIPQIKSKSVIKIHFPFFHKKIIPATFKEHYAYLLGLHDKTKTTIPKIPEKYLEFAQKEYKRLNLNPQNTIILSPFSQYFNSNLIPVNFWLKLAQELEKTGYNVLFNTKDEIYRYKYENIFPNEILELIAMISMAKQIISTRAGLNDILAGYGLCNQIALYPHGLEIMKFNVFKKFNEYNKKYLKNDINKIFNLHSLKTQFQNDCSEIIYDKQTDVTEEIIKNIKGEIYGR